MTNLKSALDSAIKQRYVENKDDFSFMYSFTTENIAGYIDSFDLEGKKLLTVGSSGDQALNAVLKGCTDITVLDVNKYVKYYYYLKVASIMCLDYNEFFSFFKYYYDNVRGFNKETFNKEVFDKVKEVLKEIDSDSFEFWNTLFEMFDGIDIRVLLFNADECSDFILKKLNPYLSNEASFKGAIDKLQSVKPCFITGRVEDISISEKFDSIWLSNICQYIPLDKVIKAVNKLSNNLNDDGKMLFAYLYKYNIFKGYINETNFYTIQYVKALFPKGLVEVEQFESTTSGDKDAILTYKRKLRHNKK